MYLSWFIPKLAVREISRHKRQTVLIIIGLMISTAVITGSLVAGDSMEQLVYISTFENLGEVDQVIQASDFFDYKYYNSILNNKSIQSLVDGSAPVLLLPAALESIGLKLRDNKAQLFGFDHHLLQLGKFTSKSQNKKLDADEIILNKNEIIINELLADKLEIKEDGEVRLIITNPSYKINTVYSSSKETNSIEKILIVKYIVEHDNLGRIQLDGRTSDTTNIFMNLTHLQNLLRIGNKINSILISNNGDKYSGIENDDEVKKALKESLDDLVGFKELGYKFNSSGAPYLRLVNNNDIFFDDKIYNLLTEPSVGYGEDYVVSPVLTYFVNSIFNYNTSRIINYSIVTGLDFKEDEQFGKFSVSIDNNINNIELANDEMVLIDWSAEQLGARVGDQVSIEYMVLDKFYNIHNLTHEFTIKSIVALTGKAADEYLMPEFPGLAGELDCVNWDPEFPVDLNRITKADRDFWFENQGTPKAYISLSQAQSIWSTNLGSLTMIKLNTTVSSGKSLSELRPVLEDHLNLSLGYSDAEFSILQVKSDALATARGMSIFPMMFLTFSSAIIIAGMALIITIFLIIAEYRKSEFGIVRAIGLRKGQVIMLYLAEGAIYCILAGFLGIIFGIFLGWGIVSALNSIWSSAVQNYNIPLYFKPVSLLIGFSVGFFISLITILLTARHIANKNIISSIYGTPEFTKASTRGKILMGGLIFFIGILILILGVLQNLQPDTISFEDGKYYFWLMGPVLILLGSILIINFSVKRVIRRFLLTAVSLSVAVYIVSYSIYIMPQQNVPIMELFFMIGFMLVFCFVLIIIFNLDNLANFLIKVTSRGISPKPVASYALKNPTRQLGRTAQTITIFSLIIFLLTALSINIAIQKASVDVVSYEERGGYDIIGETAVPIGIDLNDPSQRLENNLNDPILNNVSITEIKLVGPPGGTCSNMNVRYPPRLLGVDSGFISDNSFRFIETRSGSKHHRDTWHQLEKRPENNNGRIPIVVDYNTLVWIYNGGLGEIYEVESELGRKVKLEVIGVLENTVFGGTFLMWQDNLEELYPNSAEYRYVLFKFKPGVKSNSEDAAVELEQALYIYGLDAQAISELIRKNREYEQSFMVLFQAFLAFGLILGMIGLGVITTRTVLERKVEIGILRSLGFTRKMILKSFLIELSFIVLLALLMSFIIGLVSSYLAFGSWTGGIYEFVVPWLDLVLIFIIVYIITLFSGLYPAYRASRIPPAEALRRLG